MVHVKPPFLLACFSYLFRLSACLLSWLLAKMPIHELFDKFDTLELEHLGVLFQTPIERHADLPGPRKHLRIRDGGFVVQRIWTARRVAFDHAQSIAMVVSGPVKPGILLQARHVDDQRLALESPDRVS